MQTSGLILHEIGRLQTKQRKRARTGMLLSRNVRLKILELVNSLFEKETLQSEYAIFMPF
jgi:hypothetical protein